MESDHAELSVRRQCELLGLNRSRLYFEPSRVSDRDLSLMEKLDRWHLDYPYFGESEAGPVGEFTGGGGEPETGAATDASDGAGVPIS